VKSERYVAENSFSNMSHCMLKISKQNNNNKTNKRKHKTEGQSHQNGLKEIFIHWLENRPLPNNLTPGHFRVTLCLSVSKSECSCKTFHMKISLIDVCVKMIMKEGGGGNTFLYEWFHTSPDSF